MKSILHHLIEDRVSGIGSSLQLGTRVNEHKIDYGLGISEFVHPIASEHGEEVPGEERNKGDEKEKVANEATTIFRRSFNCHCNTIKLSEILYTSVILNSPSLSKVQNSTSTGTSSWFDDVTES